MTGHFTRIKKIYRESGRIFKGFLSKHFKKNCIERQIKQGNYKSFPVYIISYNQLSYVRGTVNWLKEKGYDNITIIDNHSSYEPLLKYYDECGCRVIRMSKNYGHSVFYKCLRFWFARTFKFYCLTDPDLMPVSDCPDDFVELFLRIMRNYPQMPKVGFSLKIDDIPDEYEKKEAVIKWESKWYADEIEAGGGTCQLYYAQLDTTFSLQSPAIFTANLVHSYSAIRTGFPYQLRHLPWYVTSKNEEQQYYLNTSKSGINHW